MNSRVPTSHSDDRPVLTPAYERRVHRSFTERDLRICQLLERHRVLTGHQIATAFFPTTKSARERLIVLYRNHVLDRFRPEVSPGSAPFHYTLDVVGASACAADRGAEPPERRRRVAERWQRSPRLAHLMGINGFFTDLMGRARTTGDAHLAEWWSEARCTGSVLGVANSDGYGVWQEGRRRCEFYLEVDRGTENSKRLLDKMVDYAELRAAAGVDRPVLFWLPSRRREESVRRALAEAPIPVATAVAGSEPWSAIWRTVATESFVSLIELGVEESGERKHD